MNATRSDPKRTLAPTGSEACPPSVFPLGGRASVTASTLGHVSDFSSFCGDTSGAAPDLVHGFALTSAGTLKINVEPRTAGFNAAVYLRTDCTVDELCFDFGGVGTPEQIALDAPASSYFVVVDGAPGGVNAGTYALRASFAAPACGDGVVNASAGEQCDPGPSAREDGCSSACQFEPPGPDDMCPGSALTIQEGTTIIAGSTVGYGNDYAGTKSLPPGGADRVYAVAPEITGILTVEIGLDAAGLNPVCSNITNQECWDRVLYARSSCADATTELAFSDVGATDVESITLQVTAGVPISLFVDGYDAQTYSSGPYHLVFDLQP